MALAVLHASFNQDYGCFAVGTTTGFRVYNCEPFKETFCRNLNSGVAIVEMLFRCNIQALVGDGSSDAYPRHTVKMWDDHKRQCIGELNFRGEVRGVRLRRDRIVVVLEHKVLVYNFADLKLLHQIDTLANPRGLVAISSAADSTVLVTPGLHTGQVRIELYDRKQTKFISAHTTPLAALALSLCGKRCATASDKGTLVRVWGTGDGALLQELRRGSEPATIFSIALSKHCEWLAVTSDKPTVHVFALSEAVATGSEAGGNKANGSSAAAAEGGQQPPHQQQQQAALPLPPQPIPAVADGGSSDSSLQQQQQRQNPTSMLSMFKGYVPIPLPIPKYFNSQWSFAQYKLPDEEPGRCIVGFANIEPHTLVIVTQSGRYHKVTFDPVKGGACSQRAYGMYLAPHPDDD